ncbi:MAG: TauD/TfdA family dioxygenase, partial [Novosphingobium sp.]|nr:TauD/TfdA family dioxygenase [Novosphingobium sp.]
MADITVSNLRDDLSFGATIEGLDWGNIDDEATRQQIRDVFHDRGMIVFRNMEPTAKMQVAVSKIFGPLKDHPTKTTPRDDETGDEAQGVIDMFHAGTTDPNDNAGIVRRNGQRLARFAPWHFDHCYNDELNYAGVLRSPVNSPAGEGGRTGFMDGIEVYRQLRDDLREKMEDINVIYTLDTRLSKSKYAVDYEPLGEVPTTTELLKEVAIFPRAMHPAVWTRDTGEKVFHAAPWMAVGLEHHEDEEGDKLFDEVCRELTSLGQGTCAYWHQWEPTDMVIWDNT